MGRLQKGSLELVLQQKGELLLLSSSHQHKNKYKHPVLLASLENSSGTNPRRPRAQPDENLQHSSSSPKREIRPRRLPTSTERATRSSPPSFGVKTALLKNHGRLFCRDTEEEQPGSATTSAS